MISYEFTKIAGEERARRLRAEAREARRARLAKALKR
jgi:hypothetical protein